MKQQISTVWGIVILVIFAVATASVISWFLDAHKIPTIVLANQTAGLKTYTNAQYDFTLQYPESWYIDHTVSPQSADFAIAKSSNPDYVYAVSGPGDFAFDIGVDKEYLAKGETAQDFLAKEMIQYAPETNFKEINFQGYRGIYYTYDQTEQNPGSAHYEFVRDNHFFDIGYAYNGVSDGVGEKIISTFTFIK